MYQIIYYLLLLLLLLFVSILYHICIKIMWFLGIEFIYWKLHFNWFIYALTMHIWILCAIHMPAQCRVKVCLFAYFLYVWTFFELLLRVSMIGTIWIKITYTSFDSKYFKLLNKCQVILVGRVFLWLSQRRNLCKSLISAYVCLIFDKIPLLSEWWLIWLETLTLSPSWCLFTSLKFVQVYITKFCNADCYSLEEKIKTWTCVLDICWYSDK